MVVLTVRLFASLPRFRWEASAVFQEWHHACHLEFKRISLGYCNDLSNSPGNPLRFVAYPIVPNNFSYGTQGTSESCRGNPDTVVWLRVKRKHIGFIVVLFRVQ